MTYRRPTALASCPRKGWKAALGTDMKKTLSTQMKSSPVPSSVLIRGNAVETTVASRDTIRAVSHSTGNTIQNRHVCCASVGSDPEAGCGVVGSDIA
ncbi:unnamed protein product [Cercospora beticola]|nr:unnamed protein product [Cercospora beticola]